MAIRKKRADIIVEIWKYGMKNPNFQINDLEKHLKKIAESEDDINFCLAYVRKNFFKNRNTDEYLIDQDSISNLISHIQWKQAKRSFIISSIISSTTLVVTVITLLFTMGKCSHYEQTTQNSDSVRQENCQQDSICPPLSSSYIFPGKDGFPLK